MRAVLVEAFGAPPVVTDVPEPVCPPDGAVVRVDATGLCRSDWHAFAGHDPDVVLPHVPGHEFAGVVEAVGADVAGWSPGDRVTAPFVNACGSCATCRRGDHQVCERQTQPGFDRWGSFAERAVVARAEVNLVRLPPGVDAVAAAALGCRFATAYRAVLQVAGVRAGEVVAVHGCGGVGLSAVMIAVAAGARVVAVDVREEALAAAVRLGAQAGVLVPAGPADPLARADDVRSAAGGDVVDVSLDALGSPGTAAASVACLRPGGRHVQVGLLPAALGWPALPMHLVIARELRLLGSHGMAAHAYPPMLDLVARGRLRPADLVTGRIGLDAVPAALAALGGAPPTGITVVLPHGEPV